jgi:hypothetical protein
MKIALTKQQDELMRPLYASLENAEKSGVILAQIVACPRYAGEKGEI